MRCAVAVGGKARVVGEVVAIEAFAQSGPECVIARGDHDGSIGGGDGLEGCDRGVAGPQRFGGDSGGRKAADGVFECRDGAVEHREIDHGALPRCGPAVNGRDDGHGAEDAGQDVADRGADADRLTRPGSGDAHQATECLHDDVVGGPVGVAAGVAET